MHHTKRKKKNAYFSYTFFVVFGVHRQTILYSEFGQQCLLEYLDRLQMLITHKKNLNYHNYVVIKNCSDFLLNSVKK
jgi:hypothetical protein